MTGRHFVTGWARLVVSGAEPERIFTLAAQVGMPFWDAAPARDFSLSLCVRYKDAEALREIARRKGLDCLVARAGGLPVVGRSLRRRWALLGAAGLCALALMVGRLFIWRVEITETAGVSESAVREALRECGVDVGQFWPGFSQDLTRNALLRRMPELRWATVNLRGGCAEVILRPARGAPEVENEGECADIVAARGGYITQVQALRGDAQVTSGQTVLEGETLISGEAVGRYESHGATRAIGTVWARTWYELTAAAPLQTRQTALQAPLCTRWALIFGKMRINFYKGCSICPASCAKMEEETALSLAGVFRWPLRLVRERVYETEATAAPEDELASRLQKQLAQRLCAALGDEGELVDARFTQSEQDGWLYVTMHAECSESIGVTVPMTAAQIAAKSPQTKEDDS